MIEPHTHCWHFTNTMLTSNPPQRVDVCCICGEKRNLVIKQMQDLPEGHGKYHPLAIIKEITNE